MAEPPQDQFGLVLYRLSQLESALNQRFDGLSSDLRIYDGRLRQVELDMAQLRERLTVWQAAQAVFTTIVGTVSAFFGRLP